MAIFFYDVDNTYRDIAYSTGWNEYPDENAYGGSVTSTFNEATASFNFTGMAVSVQCDKIFDSESNDSAVFNVDNGPWTPILVSDSGSTEPYTCWSSGSLGSEGQHILNIKNVVNGTPLRIDKITYMVYLPDTIPPSSTITDSSTIDTSTTIVTLPSTSSATATSTDTAPSSTCTSFSESMKNFANRKTLSIGIISIVAVLLGLILLLAYIRKRRPRNLEPIFPPDVSYLPTHRPGFVSNSTTQRPPMNDVAPTFCHLPRPQPTYAIPTRDGVGSSVFPPPRTHAQYNLEANVPTVMPPKRSKLRDTILFPRLSRHPVRSARM